MAIYPEDDDLDLERELDRNEDSMKMMGADMERMSDRNRHIRKTLQKKQLDPLVAKAIELAIDGGRILGLNEGLNKKVQNLNKRIEVRDIEIRRTADRDSWKARAEAAEATIERSKKRKRR